MTKPKPKGVWRQILRVDRIKKSRITKKGEEGPETEEIWTYILKDLNRKFPQVVLKSNHELEDLQYGLDLDVVLSTSQTRLEDHGDKP